MDYQERKIRGKNVSIAETQKLIGVLLLGGVCKSKNENINQQWYLAEGRPILIT